jgi:succinate dehydrogenase / fumarate reductase membrane anchor subunit
MTASEKPILVSPSSFALSWKWMRYSAFLLIPLVWIHSIIQALITGGPNLSLEYVHMRWFILGWRVYDIFLLAFAFSHGVLGLRQVLFDYIHNDRAQKIINWMLFLFWFFVSLIGALAIIGGVRLPSA